MESQNRELVLLAILITMLLMQSLPLNLLQWFYQVEVIPLPPLNQLSRLETNGFGKRLAIVIPFTRTDIPRLISDNIARWPSQSCQSERKYGSFIDIIFFYNRDISELDDTSTASLKKALNSRNRCFGNVKFLQARLNQSEEGYPLGPTNMFFRLFHLPRLASDYHAMLLMEWDLFPCRRNWLDRVYEEAVLDSEYWIKGSILRDSRSDKAFQSYTFADHINGNAWYRIGDPQFHRFMTEKVELNFRRNPAQYLNSYDVAVELVKKDRNILPWSEYVRIRHRFKHSSVIQNYYRGQYNLTTICAESGTYLVHGKNLYR